MSNAFHTAVRMILFATSCPLRPCKNSKALWYRFADSPLRICSNLASASLPYELTTDEVNYTGDSGHTVPSHMIGER